ncbi:hypothetical protein PHAVU_009G165000 [Phaseolus vulgaris]|uniref:Uncharacterized protein n=1 Tax=Phaseolus vulgaris TaxID=3885 RepID=V7AX56_PHAVU|nr:hypothetical protein PHAVU_009G165000g [Phaseolus vulgaris]ESW09890.1 hypothetical protein PHAVU_009G165000g [Phaseolus vulgaris]
MESSQGKGKRTEELHQRFKKLEQEWEAYKESKPTASRKHSLPPSNKTIQKPHKYSSRELMFNLQQESPSPPEAWKNVTRIKDVAVREILQERREAIERGKLKGRRLFQSSTSEDESSDREVRSISFCNSEEQSNGSEGVHDYCSRELSSLSSSSSSCFAGDDNHDQDMEKMAHLMAMIAEMRVASVSGTRGNGRRRYAVFLGGVAVILLVIAMYMSLARSFGGEDCDMILVPT